MAFTVTELADVQLNPDGQLPEARFGVVCSAGMLELEPLTTDEAEMYCTALNAKAKAE